MIVMVDGVAGQSVLEWREKKLAGTTCEYPEYLVGII